MAEHKRKVGERGQITIPKDVRDRRGIEAGDEVTLVESDGAVMIKLSPDEERLAEGYQKRADRSRELTNEMEDASAEVSQHLGDAPGWSE
jgi:AbrB family looped-hinge helix DNA binding protein